MTAADERYARAQAIVPEALERPGHERDAFLADACGGDSELRREVDANVRELPWTFTAEQVTQEVRIGQTGLAFFKVTNNGDKPVTGRAIYNVVPESAGAYFQKLECFCFDDQTIAPGATMQFPMQYFIAPEMVDDREVDGVREITLSYTFYPVPADQVASNQVASRAGTGAG